VHHASTRSEIVMQNRPLLSATDRFEPPDGWWRRARSLVFRNVGLKVVALVAAIALWAFMHSPSRQPGAGAPNGAAAPKCVDGAR